MKTSLTIGKSRGDFSTERHAYQEYQQKKNNNIKVILYYYLLLLLLFKYNNKYKIKYIF